MAWEMGTPDYMAPEQWIGKASPTSDQYALGVVFYELVTGCKPYTAETSAAVLLKQAYDPPPGPRQFIPGIPDSVCKDCKDWNEVVCSVAQILQTHISLRIDH